MSMETTAWMQLHSEMNAQQETRPFARATLRRIGAFARPHRRSIAFFVVLGVLTALLAVATPVLAGDVVDAIVSDGDEGTVVRLALLIALIAVAEAALGILGQYSGSVADQWTPYIRPQENGNKTDVRWVALTDAQGTGLLVSGEPQLEFNASHFTPEDLSSGVRHDYQLTPRDDVVLRVNHRQMGLGGDNSWGAHTHDAYKLFADRDYACTYRLRPLTDLAEATAVSRRPTAGE